MARTMTEHAATAKMVRATLKQAFPTVTFSVRSRSFAGGNDVRVEWTDGPTAKEVEALVSQHKYGHFDGMIDLYEYSNVRDDIPQVKYLSPTRRYSREATEAIVAWLNSHWAGYNLRVIDSPHGSYMIDRASDAPRGNGSGWQSQDVYRELQAMSLLCKDCGAATLPGDQFCPMCGHSLVKLEAIA